MIIGIGTKARELGSYTSLRTQVGHRRIVGPVVTLDHEI
jgi:hypothetical protein